MAGVESEQQEPWDIWREAAAREDIDRAIRKLYDEIGAAVAERRPVCNASGRCCKFEQYGHRLYVTGLEIAWFLAGVRGQVAGVLNEPVKAGNVTEATAQFLSLQQLGPNPNPQTLSPNCPYQVNGLCSTHTIRPLGCRVFFCEQGTEAWQQDTTEHFLNRLKQLHAEHDLPYAYMEWRAGLAKAGQLLDGSN